MSNNSLSADKNGTIDREPTTESNRFDIELPNLSVEVERQGIEPNLEKHIEKKEVELVLKNDEIVHQIDDKNGVSSKTRKVCNIMYLWYFLAF